MPRFFGAQLDTVVPLPNTTDDGAEDVQGAKEKDCNLEDGMQPSASASSNRTLVVSPGDAPLMPDIIRSSVTLFFDEDAADAVGSLTLNSRGQGGTTSFTPSMIGQQKSGTRTANSPESNVSVGRCFFLFSRFLRSSADGRSLVVDTEMEEKFARQKYGQFCTAFMLGAIILSLGCVVMTVNAIVVNNVTRAVIMGAGILPIYAFIGFWVLKRRKAYLKASGTVQERILFGLLAVQCLLIVASEWVRRDADYGLLVMQMGFIYNFSPLCFGMMVFLTVVFGLAPYVLLVVLYALQSFSYGKVVWGIDDWYDPTQGCLTSGTSSAFEAQQRIFVPIFIMVMQAFVTKRRDECLRVDALTKENLRTQRRLLDDEKERNEGLLKSMLPWKVIQALKLNEPIQPQLFDDVTVVFIEICDFNRLCNELPPDDVMDVLNVIYHEFDRLSDLLSVYKVETVMQVYMAVVGCPVPVSNHADTAAHFALSARRSLHCLQHRIETIRNKSLLKSGSKSLPEVLGEMENPMELQIHIGLNSGPLRAGVVGMESPRYKLVGDTVNTASRMESTAEPGKIQASPSTLQRFTKGMFELEDRGEIAVKGKGMIRTAYIKGYTGDDGSYTRHRVVVEQRRKPLDRHSSFNGLASPTSPGGSSSHNGGGLRRAMSSSSVTSWMSGRTESHLSHNDDEVLRTFSGTASSVAAPVILEEPSSPNATEAEDPHSRLGMPMSAVLNFPVNLAGRTVSTGRKTLEHSLASVSHGRKNLENSLAAMVDAALGREEAENVLRLPTTATAGAAFLGKTQKRAEQLWDWICRLMLLVPPSQKTASRLLELDRDYAEYMRQVMPSRVSLARKITTVVLVILSVIFSMETGVTHSGVENMDDYSDMQLTRHLGCNLVGLLYLLAIGSERWLSTRCLQAMTMIMLILEDASLMVITIAYYQTETVILAAVVSFCTVTLFYTVCTLLQRLVICLMAVIVYIVARSVSCGSGSNSTDYGAVESVESVMNIGFVVVFVLFMACGVRLQEHLAHVAHFEQRHTKERLDRIKTAKAAGSVLLGNMLPPHVISLVCGGISPIAENHNDVTVIFTDIRGFTAFSSRISPFELFTVLNSMFSAFDEIILNWGLYKVEVIGDAYFISAGCPVPAEEQISPSEYAMRAVEVGLALQRCLPSVCEDASVMMRVGLHTGSVVAGVVGKKGPRYHLFGSTVGYAEKMESSGVPGRVQISSATHAILVNSGKSYEFEERSVALEGEQQPQTTYLVGKSKSKEAVHIQMQLAQRRHQAMTMGTPGS